ncbi:MAG: prepilin peptidase [Sphingomonas sp.]
MGGATLNALMLGALALLLVSAGLQDARTREIANWKNAGIAMLAPLWWWSNGFLLWPDLAIHLGIAAGVFALFLVPFYFGWMGGGDVKMIGALALWFPLQGLLWMLIIMSLLGGALTLLIVIDRAVRRKSEIEVPYGVAIAIAALISLPEPFLNHFL